MDVETPISLLNPPNVAHPHSPCVNPENGDFVVTFWGNYPYTYLFNMCGWIKRRVYIPTDYVSRDIGCAFASSKLFISASDRNAILQFTSEGGYEKVFATGYRFCYITPQQSLLYVNVIHSNVVLLYDIPTGKLETQFEVTSGNARGMAFDPENNLHVAIWKTNIVEVLTASGEPVRKISYPEVEGLDGMTIDNSTNSILVDRSGKQVMVYDDKNELQKQITGFNYPIDVTMGYDCHYILVTDINRGTYMLG